MPEDGLHYRERRSALDEPTPGRVAKAMEPDGFGKSGLTGEELEALGCVAWAQRVPSCVAEDRPPERGGRPTERKAPKPTERVDLPHDLLEDIGPAPGGALEVERLTHVSSAYAVSDQGRAVSLPRVDSAGTSRGGAPSGGTIRGGATSACIRTTRRNARRSPSTASSRTRTSGPLPALRVVTVMTTAWSTSTASRRTTEPSTWSGLLAARTSAE